MEIPTALEFVQYLTHETRCPHYDQSCADCGLWRDYYEFLSNAYGTPYPTDWPNEPSQEDNRQWHLRSYDRDKPKVKSVLHDLINSEYKSPYKPNDPNSIDAHEDDEYA